MDGDSLSRRLGNFFILTGLMLVVLFTLSSAGGSPQATFLLGGGTALAIGYRLYRKATPPPPSNRFGLLRKAREKTRQRQEQRRKTPPGSGAVRR